MLARSQTWIGWVLIGACWSEEPLIDDTFTEDQWAFLQTLRAPEPELCPPQLSNPTRCAIAADLGKNMFFDRSLSGPIDYSANPIPPNDPSSLGNQGEVGKIGCVDCHDPKSFFIDTRTKPGNVSLGAKGRTRHNAMSPVNVSLKAVVARENCERGDADPFECSLVFSWTGKYPTAGEVLQLAGAGAMNTKGERLAMAIRGNGAYTASYVSLFEAFPEVCTFEPGNGSYACTCPPNPDGLPCSTPAEVFGNVSLVLETYLRQLNSVNTPFDCYVQKSIANGKTIGECVNFAGTPRQTQFDDAERRGLAIFIGKGMCVDCHRGPLLSDLRFHNTGVAQIGPFVPATDGGYGAETFGDLEVPDSRLGEFLTPPLRHVARTAPYMHAGQYATLGEVIEFYRRGGDSQGFSGSKDLRMQPLEITDDEARDLEAFLRSLTGVEDELAEWVP